MKKFLIGAGVSAAVVLLALSGGGEARPRSAEGLRFAAFTDTHIGAAIDTGYGLAEHLDLLADDIANAIPGCAFAVHLGDIIHHSTATVAGVGLPAPYAVEHNNFAKFLLRRQKLPFFLIPGNVDLLDYFGEKNSGFPKNADDPFAMLRALMDVSELMTIPYAFMKDNILFIALPEPGYIHTTKPTVRAYVEYLTRRYPGRTTVILSHQAVEDTTRHGDEPAHPYRGKQDRAFWSDLFRRNPQIKMWIHGHQHMEDWYRSDRSSGAGFPVELFGHEMVFVCPPAQADFGDRFEEDRIGVFTIDETGFRVAAWRNDGAGGAWDRSFEHAWEIPTTYDDAASDWIGIPAFLQDGEIQRLDSKILAAGAEMELVGLPPMELFYDSTFQAHGDNWAKDNILGFADDPAERVIPTHPGMTALGPTALSFPPKFPGPGKAFHEDGRTGQPYRQAPFGTTHAGVPGAEYLVSLTSFVPEGKGRVVVEMSVADWGAKTQYSVLAGSEKIVIDGLCGSAATTLTGTFRVPDSEAAWFLQGAVRFADAGPYHVSEFSIRRLAASAETEDFKLKIGRVEVAVDGPLSAYEHRLKPLDQVLLADGDGVIEMRADIGGNRTGLAHLVFRAPLLIGRGFRLAAVEAGPEGRALVVRSVTTPLAEELLLTSFGVEPGRLVAVMRGASATVGSGRSRGSWISWPPTAAEAGGLIDIRWK